MRQVDSISEEGNRMRRKRRKVNQLLQVKAVVFIEAEDEIACLF